MYSGPLVHELLHLEKELESLAADGWPFELCRYSKITYFLTSSTAFVVFPEGMDMRCAQPSFCSLSFLEELKFIFLPPYITDGAKLNVLETPDLSSIHPSKQDPSLGTILFGITILV